MGKKKNDFYAVYLIRVKVRFTVFRDCFRIGGARTSHYPPTADNNTPAGVVNEITVGGRPGRAVRRARGRLNYNSDKRSAVGA